MKHLLLTLDYELYGDGSGGVFQHIIKPTNRIIEIVESHNAKITIFFEVIEYWRLKEQWEKGNNMGYANNPIYAIEEQLRIAYKKGHDIQLHLHPQWINAQWINGKWIVDNNYWRLSALSENEIVELFTKGKETIEGIINDSNYHCHAVRAGGYNIQPSAAIIKAMRKCGLSADCSIYPGGYEQGSLSKYDYRKVPEVLGKWYCGDTLKEVAQGATDITELPIVAFPMLRLQKYLSLDRIRAIWRNRNSASKSFAAKTVTDGAGKKSKFSKVAYFFRHEAQTWDFCLFSISMHRTYLKKISRQKERDIFVLVGHPKSFVTGKGMEYLLKHAEKEKYDFPTISNLQE